MAPPKRVITAKEHHTILTRSIENGIIASAPARRSQARKTINNTPEPQNRPIIVPLFHASFVPPHSIARSNMTASGANIVKPTRSNFVMTEARVCLLVVFAVEALRVSGMLINRRKPTATPPMGRLI